MLKISGRDFTESELKLLKSWVNELKASDELIKEAYEITVMNTGKIAFKYMDTVIKNNMSGDYSPASSEKQIKPQKKNSV